MVINDDIKPSNKKDSDEKDKEHDSWEISHGKFNNWWKADTIDETDNYSLKRDEWSNKRHTKYIYQYDEDKPRSRYFTEEDYYDPDALVAWWYSEWNYNEFYHWESIENDDRTIWLSDEEF